MVVLDKTDINAPAIVEVESGRSTITRDVNVDPRPDDVFTEAIWQFGNREVSYSF